MRGKACFATPGEGGNLRKTSPSRRAKEKPRRAAGLSFIPHAPKLAALARLLLLLAGLGLAAALLLLAGLLARILILLARLLVGAAHSSSPLLIATSDNEGTAGWLQCEQGSRRELMCRSRDRSQDQCKSSPTAKEPAAKTILYKPF
jgi:hypothetical protein